MTPPKRRDPDGDARLRQRAVDKLQERTRWSDRDAHDVDAYPGGILHRAMLEGV